jgi:hypothetical protein
MKIVVIPVLLTLIAPLGSNAKAEEIVGAPKSQAQGPSVADRIASQFYPYSAELTIPAVDLWSIPSDGNLDHGLTQETGLSGSAMNQSSSMEAVGTELNLNAQGYATKLTLEPNSYEPRWRKADLLSAPIKKTDEVVIYKNVEFSGVLVHLTDLFREPRNFLQLFNPFAPPGYGVSITAHNGFVLLSFGF